ncbi:hypothetical protein RCL1_007035 [Eukaryota sp. TZLM3-RCL]
MPKPKPPKGTRDFGPAEMRVREEVFNKIKAIFHKHGANAIDTPVFELREVLMGKYGEEQKLVYDLADQGGELCCLRYDLTVPFARFVASNSIDNIKRYHIGKVYRRDQPGKGRFREFYQCDFDIAGTYPSMFPDSEVVTVIAEILESVNVGPFVLLVNHRGLLDAMVASAGISEDKFKTVCSSIDKLDKHAWNVVAEELIKEKNIDPEHVEKLKTFVEMKNDNPLDLLQMIRESPLIEHVGGQKAVDDMTQFFEILETLPNVLNRIRFDLSLARGLDYYTGLVFEGKLVDSRGNFLGGSIAGGGRYDNLLGMFSSKSVPAVGTSIGIERIFALVGDKLSAKQTPLVSVYVASPVKGRANLLQRFKVAGLLWNAGISAEYYPKENARMDAQLNHCLANFIPFMVITGDAELARGAVGVKNLATSQQEEVQLDCLVTYLLAALNPV